MNPVVKQYIAKSIQLLFSYFFIVSHASRCQKDLFAYIYCMYVAYALG